MNEILRLDIILPTAVQKNLLTCKTPVDSVGNIFQDLKQDVLKCCLILDSRLILQHRSDVRKPVCEKYDQPMNQPQDGTYPDVRLIYCGVTDEGCAALASALRLNPSHLRELDLSENKLGDSVKLLSDVLQNPHCKLEKLRLIYCGITYEGCAALASALRSNPTHLRHLDLSWNKLGDSVKLLSDVIQSPHCKLKKL
ncbi:hypothetical protein cypCar_00041951, partial [Cyprinus carpio]